MLRISKNYSCIRFDTMNFINYLVVIQANRADVALSFNPTNINHVKFCFRINIPGYIIRRNDWTRVNEPVSNKILVTR